MATLFIVSTPIGNLADISARAVEVLGQVSAIAAEDTRHSRRLLEHLGLSTPLISYHDHNEQSRTPALLQRLQQGEDLALISDAGTPLVSDPGYRLVRAARQAGVRVSPVPGASALLAALAVAGLPSDQFHFQGFAPPKGRERQKALQEAVARKVTTVLYEAPHRMLNLLDELAALAGGEREVALCRELTKRFETVLAGTLSSVSEAVQADANQLKGEMVLVLAGQADTDVDDEQLATLARLLLAELPVSRVARVLAAFSGRRRQAIYGWLEQLQQGE
jgi:16S rRNA (cytidine1402-2'-O)-methyltransferase